MSRGEAAPRLLPMLAGGNGLPPALSAYQLEPKFDGQRALATVEHGRLTLTNRRGAEITATYPDLAGLGPALAPHRVVLDGEVVAFNASGQTSFQRLQRRMHVRSPAAPLLAEVPVVFVVFDVLWLDGEPLVELPQAERRAILERLEVTGARWQTAPVLDATIEELLEAGRQLGLEGYMAKRLDAPYLPGARSPAWWKIKTGRRRRDFVVAGWSAGQGSRSHSIGSLALGCYDVTAEQAALRGRPPRLFYVGQAGSGLTEDMISQLRRLFDQIGVDTSPFERPPPLPLHHVQPLLVADVAFSEVTEAGTLRQPSLKGLRPDMVAGEVTWDDEIAASFADRS